MTISGITQTYASFSAMRLTINVNTPQASSKPAAGATTAPTDTVSLSPEATAPPAASGGTSATTPVSETPTPATPPADAPPDRASALFAALDADQDGSITEDEFKTGAKQILSQGRRPHRADGDGDHEHGDHGVHEGRGSRRLDRKLDRLFDRIDANGDGSLDKTELTDALAAADKRREPPPPPQSTEPGAGQPVDPAAGQGASNGTVVTFTMTFVSIAVKRYTSLQGDAPTGGSATTGATTPATSPTAEAPNQPAVEPPLAA
ncbi:MAG: EF-hand domain-containing protein [Vicinamibacterales bacterium]